MWDFVIFELWNKSWKVGQPPPHIDSVADPSFLQTGIVLDTYVGTGYLAYS